MKKTIKGHVYSNCHSDAGELCPHLYRAFYACQQGYRGNVCRCGGLDTFHVYRYKLHTANACAGIQ